MGAHKVSGGAVAMNTQLFVTVFELLHIVQAQRLLMPMKVSSFKHVVRSVHQIFVVASL